jgi:uncharacterized protein
MKTERSHQKVHGFTTMFIVIAIIVGILKIPFAALFEGSFNATSAKDAGTLIQVLLIISLGVMLIRRMHLPTVSGLRLLHLPNSAFLLIPFIYPMVLAIPGMLRIGISGIANATALFSVFVWMLRGISEEVIFRGYVQGVLLKRYRGVGSLQKVVVIDGLIFGGAHIVSLYGHGFVDVINLVIGASFLGVLLSALQLKVGNLWVLGLIHGLINVVFGWDEMLGRGTAERSVSSTGEVIKAIALYIVLFLPLLFIARAIVKSVQKKQTNASGEFHHLHDLDVSKVVAE